MKTPLDRWRAKVALVTGASSGIGRAIAVELGRLQMKVGLVGRNECELQQVAGEVRRGGGMALVVNGDQANLETNPRIFREIRTEWGGVDVLINSAGVRGGASVHGAPLAEIVAGFQVNVLAAVACMREAVADMRDKADAAIINISSMSGHRLLPGTPAPYAAAKHALRIITDGLRAELAAEKLPIKVALISPGLVDTPWHRQPDGLITRKGAFPYEPLQPIDVVEAVRFILSAPSRVQIGDIQVRATAQPF